MYNSKTMSEASAERRGRSDQEDVVQRSDQEDPERRGHAGGLPDGIYPKEDARQGQGLLGLEGGQQVPHPFATSDSEDKGLDARHRGGKQVVCKFRLGRRILPSRAASGFTEIHVLHLPAVDGHPRVQVGLHEGPPRPPDLVGFLL